MFTIGVSAETVKEIRGLFLVVVATGCFGVWLKLSQPELQYLDSEIEEN